MKTEKIEKSKYQGYLWYSDKTKPKVLIDQDFELELCETNNPFIVEGQLFDGNVSISIKYVDGKYIAHKIDVQAEYPDKEYTEREFIANKMGGVDKLIFRQYWKAQPDELCEGMPVLQPDVLVFVGFKLWEG